MFIVTVLLFILVCLFSFYLPGKVALHALKLKFDKAQQEVVSWFLGISLFLFISYFFAWINLTYGLFFLLFISLFSFIKQRKELFRRFSWKKIDKLSLVIILLGSLAFSYTMFFSGIFTPEGMQLVIVNNVDGIRHVAYIKSQAIFFPPQQPGFAGESLRGFHYFYDFLLSRFIVLYGFSAEDLYFRLFPLFISVLYGSAFYVFASLMTKNVFSRRWILLFAYFAQSFAFLFWLFDRSLVMDLISVSQPISFLINPFTVLSIGLLLCGLALLPKVKESWKYALLVGFFLGMISEIKVYAGLIGIFCVSVFPLYVFIKNRSIAALRNYLLAIIITAIVTAVTFLPNNYNEGELIFAPLLYYREFMQRSLFDSLHWEMQRTIFAENNNIPRIILLYLQAIVLFWFLNLGTRVIIFMRIGSFMKKRFWLNDYHILLIFAILFPVVLASLFVQSVSVFDTVQFFWFALALLSIPSGIVAGELWIHKGKLIKILLISSFIVLSAFELGQFLWKYTPSHFIGAYYKNPFQVITSLVPPEEYVIYLPTEEALQSGVVQYSNTILLSGLTGRSVYLDLGGIPSKADAYLSAKRVKNLSQLHTAITHCDEKAIKGSLQKIGSQYILTSNDYPCLATSSAVVTRFIDDSFDFFMFSD